MNTKTITSVTYILVGNMLTAYSGIGEGWSAKVIVFFGLILFFVGLIRLKSDLDEKGASGVSKLIWAAILGIIANIFSLIPIVGIIPAGITNLIAFILQLVGIVNLKHSEKLGKSRTIGANILLLALTLMILAGIFKIVPFVGGTIKTVLSFIAFVLIPFGWIKIQEAIVEKILSTSSNMSSEVGYQPKNRIIEGTNSIDFGVWMNKNKKILIVVVCVGAVLFGTYYFIFRHDPIKDSQGSTERSLIIQKQIENAVDPNSGNSKQTRENKKMDKEELWVDFWSNFSIAVKQKDKTTILKLALSDSEFDGGAGGESANDWVERMVSNVEWNTFIADINNGVVPDTYRGKGGKITKKCALYFEFKNNKWYWAGVLVD
jgi:hypothetical protein